MITNEIKRLRIKVELLQKEGCNSLLMDIIDLCKKSSLRLESEYEKLLLIDELEDNYKQKLKVLLPENSKQQKLF